MTDFVYVSNSEEDIGDYNLMSGFRSKSGRIYLVDKAPKEEFMIRIKSCARTLRRFKLGISIDEYFRQAKELRENKREFIE